MLIADAILTGVGRAGAMWGCDYDVMTIGSGTGGGFPASGVISTDEITARKPWSDPCVSSSSHGGTPLATAAFAPLEIILEEGLVTNAERVGKVTLAGLEALKEKYRCVGEVRGRG